VNELIFTSKLIPNSLKDVLPQDKFLCWPKVSLLYFLLPIHTTCVLVKLMFSPESFAYQPNHYIA
jgi:hypothetical protein